MPAAAIPPRNCRVCGQPIIGDVYNGRCEDCWVSVNAGGNSPLTQERQDSEHRRSNVVFDKRDNRVARVIR